MNIDEKKEKLLELVNQFQSNIKQYKSAIYDEANTRVDFIDKFFTLLDWDVANNQGYSEQYREVVREDKIQIEGKQKAPDYSFRIGKERKFFVEAKKPSVYIKEDIAPAYQVRRYGYTAKLPLSILTDFEEFAIYDTRIKPDKNDKASVGRIFYCDYLEYEKNFDFIYNTFSKNSILKGSFDKYIEENKNKKGTGEVDKELLKLVEEWRTELAKNIALRNNDIDIYNLNNAVQKIIDRIIFLRIAEDKEIESYENLLNLTKIEHIKDHVDNKAASENKGACSLVYQRLNNIFITANNKYNAGLFQPEKWLSELKIDDKVLTSIIKGLYYPECPYEFSILPIEILGNIYEQFLGKTIKFRNVKDGHTAIIDEKPEVRKAGGVYYTPQYIVNYIVENTIGEKIKNQTPDEISKLRICDPACGSGSFLVGAYQYLLNYHLDYWTNSKNLKKALKEEKIYQVSENNYKLTIEEKQKILINNIYGVDIDPQAVEVTKLSLYLKLLENESKESEGYLFKHSDFKLLPSLDNNIKCGNSLIGSDFYKDKDLSLFGNDEMRKVNVFDWEKEFPEVFGNKTISKFHLITFETKYSRASNGNEAVLLEPEEIDLIVDCFIDTKEKFGCKILACSILPDHVHIIIADMGNDIEKIVNHLKGYSSFHINRTLKGMVENGGRQNHLWSKSYSNTKLEDEAHLFNAINYVNNNYMKHSEKWGEEINRILKGSVDDITDPFSNWSDYEYNCGGFDVVIGNPPYSYIISDEEQKYFQSKYIYQDYQKDLYLLFLEKYHFLLKQNGLLGVIISNTWLQSVTYKKIRQYLSNEYRWKKILHLPEKVFDAIVDTHVLIFEKNKDNFYDFIVEEYKENKINFLHTLNMSNISKSGDPINIIANSTQHNLFNEIKQKSILLKEIADIYNGVKPFEKGKGKPPQTEKTMKEKPFVKEGDKPSNDWSPLLRGSLINRYINLWDNNYWILYGEWLAAPRNSDIFKYPEKIIVRQTGDSIISVIINNEFIARDNLHIIIIREKKYDLKFILGIINSKLLDFYYSIMNPEKGEALAQVKKDHVENLPIPDIFNSGLQPLVIHKSHDRLVSLVDQMLETQKLFHEKKNSTDDFSLRFLKQKIDIIDKQIDDLVYKLYGLTEDEIKIVEGE